MKSASDPKIQGAWKAACLARSHAHAPYSRFKVGVALKIKGRDELIPGCNVENASYGATVCAERVAFQNATAQIGSFEPEYLVLVTDTDPVVAPCALCLQVMAEFCSGDFPIYVSNLEGVGEKVRFGDLLPRPFVKSQINTIPGV
ncbi:MAG: cytidine deaminase [Bdellovibrionota bacterium]